MLYYSRICVSSARRNEANGDHLITHSAVGRVWGNEGGRKWETYFIHAMERMNVTNTVNGGFMGDQWDKQRVIIQS